MMIQEKRQHRSINRFVPIQDFFERVVEKCKTNFPVSEYLTVDEMFEDVVPSDNIYENKPAKYGNIYSMACAKTFYTMNMEVYTRKQVQRPFRLNNSGLEVVTRMIEGVSGTERNITTDNCFSLITLAETLLENYKLILVGTIRKS